MNEHQLRFLSLLRTPPARLSYEQAAHILNCQESHIPILVAAKLLKPLGQPPENSMKFIAASELLELVQNKTWLARVTNTIHHHWHAKNLRKKKTRFPKSDSVELAGDSA